MLEFSNGGRIVQSLSELPNLMNSKVIHADFETTSGSPAVKSTDPYHNCDVAGLCITSDNHPGAWYIPIGHHQGENLPRENVTDWWCDVIDSASEWRNQNIKYDAHVSTNWLGVLPECKLRCTMTRAKLLDSDRMHYDLESLSRDFLHEDISHYNARLRPYLETNGKVYNRDYGAVPIDVLGEYGCQDVITDRRLNRYIDANLPEQCAGVAATEDKLTTILFHMEREGLRVDPQQLMALEFQLLTRMTMLDAKMAEIAGRAFRAHVSGDCYDVLCSQFGLPVMAWNNEDDDEKENTPSFDKHALKKYAAHPHAPPGLVEAIQEYRSIWTLNNLFVTKYQELEVDGYLHSSYNQCVRTGRLSCKRPNAMQLSKAAKALVIPNEGESFLSADASQVEYRLIVHYCRDPTAIKAYADDPDTDFHQYVADWCRVKRRPAKTINFAIAYGQGEKNTLELLATNPDIVEEIKQKLGTDVSLEEFNQATRARARSLHRFYHQKLLPTLKPTARRAEQVARTRGFVFNLFGRHRHIPQSRAHIAFNTLNQSSAADLVKDRMVAVADAIKGTPIRMLTQVHDELLFAGPTEVMRDPHTADLIVGTLEDVGIDLRVPIRWEYGISEKNWADASGKNTVKYGVLKKLQKT